MTTCGHRVASTATVGRLLLLAVALAGLFAMHGLADHGASGHGQVPVAHHETVLDDAGHEAPGPGGHHEASSAELCLAVLGAGLLLVLMCGPRRPWWPGGVRRSGATTRGARLLARARDPVPPDRLVLSVHRC